MKHTLEFFIRRDVKVEGTGLEAIVRQGAGESATYRFSKWYDGTYSVSVQYRGKACGLYTEYVGDIGDSAERLDAEGVRNFLLGRLGESALEIPAFARRNPTFGA
jgi:hypothetical protein